MPTLKCSKFLEKFINCGCMYNKRVAIHTYICGYVRTFTNFNLGYTLFNIKEDKVFFDYKC